MEYKTDPKYSQFLVNHVGSRYNFFTEWTESVDGSSWKQHQSSRQIP